MGKADPDKMSFLEHLDELRSRLIKVVLWLLVGTIACWSFRDPIFHFLTQPLRVHHPDIKFIFTSPSEALMLKMKMSFFVGIFAVAPMILYQVWAFVAPGLYRHEKAYAVPFIMAGSLFFLGGAAFGHYYLFPITFRFLVDFGGTDMQFLPKVGEYYSFYSWFLLGLGLVFQLPVVIFVLARIGLVTPGFLLRKFKYAVVISFVLAAIITPTPDMVTQSLLALPMLGLYLLGIGVAALFGRPRRREVEVSAEA
jgi:sec-independent protein translocase protein TatC